MGQSSSSWPGDPEPAATRRNADQVRALGRELNERFVRYGPSQAPYSEHAQRLLETLIQGGPLCVSCAAEQLGTDKSDALKSICQLISIGCVLCDHADCRRCRCTQLVARLRG